MQKDAKEKYRRKKITKLYLPSVLKKPCPYINDSSVGQFLNSLQIKFPRSKSLNWIQKTEWIHEILVSLTKTEYQSNLVHFWVDCKSKYLPISLTFCFLPAINILYSSKYCTHLKKIRDKINMWNNILSKRLSR